MGKNIRSSSSPKALATSFPMPPLADAMDAVRLSVDRLCLVAGVEALAEMMEEDATTVCGARHRRHGNRRGYRWGHTQSEIGYHGGRVKVQRPRVRDHASKEVGLESWQVLRDGNLLLEWALNLMCPSSKQMGLLSVFHKGGSGSSLFDVKPLGFDGSSGGFGWSVF